MSGRKFRASQISWPEYVAQQLAQEKRAAEGAQKGRLPTWQSRSLPSGETRSLRRNDAPFDERDRHT